MKRARTAQEVQEAEAKKQEARRSMDILLRTSLTLSGYFNSKLQQHMQNDTCHTVPNKAVQNGALTCRSQNTTNIQSNPESPSSQLNILNQIKYFESGTLRPYQAEGLTWMTMLYENGVNGILADEMGLGKTVQIIALICHLYEKNVDGPFLICVPLSTMANWSAEFTKFAPKIPVIKLHGTREERPELLNQISANTYMLNNRKVKPVVLTSYQTTKIEREYLIKYSWQYLIVDEGHCIKNHKSQLFKNLMMYQCKNKLLLTGTPLQNNLTELWALLNFILPKIFTSVDTFASVLLLEDMKDDSKLVNEEESTNIISTIHKVLAPFMLRRLKCDVLHDTVPKKEMLVYCPMTRLQRELYAYIVHRNTAKLQGVAEEEHENPVEGTPKRRCTMKPLNYSELERNKVNKKSSMVTRKQGMVTRKQDMGTPKQDMERLMEDLIRKEGKIIKVDKSTAPFVYRITMQSPLSMFKKVVDHPYLIHFPLNPNSDKKELLVDEQLVQQSGKMLVLDAMLAKLKERGHKVLIFSTLVMLLDLIEDYLILRNYTYCRLDGSMGLQKREKTINSFNTDPNMFVFILSTRSGGLGLNLTAADTVILYDRDWNPQVDIQAQDRCHRIGQTKPVMVYTLVTKNTIDEEVIRRGNMKRRLEKIVIKDGKFKFLGFDNKEKGDMDIQELQKLLESSDCYHKIHSNGYVFSDEELDQLLDRTELYDKMTKKTKDSC